MNLNYDPAKWWSGLPSLNVRKTDAVSLRTLIERNEASVEALGRRVTSRHGRGSAADPLVADTTLGEYALKHVEDGHKPSKYAKDARAMGAGGSGWADNEAVEAVDAVRPPSPPHRPPAPGEADTSRARPAPRQPPAKRNADAIPTPKGKQKSADAPTQDAPRPADGSAPAKAQPQLQRDDVEQGPSRASVKPPAVKEGKGDVTRTKKEKEHSKEAATVPAAKAAPPSFKPKSAPAAKPQASPSEARPIKPASGKGSNQGPTPRAAPDAGSSTAAAPRPLALRSLPHDRAPSLGSKVGLDYPAGTVVAAGSRDRAMRGTQVHVPQARPQATPYIAPQPHPPRVEPMPHPAMPMLEDAPRRPRVEPMPHPAMPMLEDIPRRALPALQAAAPPVPMEEMRPPAPPPPPVRAKKGRVRPESDDIPERYRHLDPRNLERIRAQRDAMRRGSSRGQAVGPARRAVVERYPASEEPVMAIVPYGGGYAPAPRVQENYLQMLGLDQAVRRLLRNAQQDELSQARKRQRREEELDRRRYPRLQDAQRPLAIMDTPYYR